MNLVQTVLQMFGGATNLSGILAAVGGMSVIVMFLMSPVLSVIIKQNWTTQKKNIAVWIASFIATGAILFFGHAYTGSLLDVATWFVIWPLLVGGATTMHNTIWGSDGSGVSTWIEKNVLPGTDITFPTTKDAVISDAEKVAKIVFEKLMEHAAANKITTTPFTGAGTAGAVPNPSTAPLVGGATIIPQAVDPVGMAIVAQNMAIDSHASTGQSFVNPATPPIAVNAVPPITPAPATQAEVDAVGNAIATGTPVETVAPEEPAPGGSE